MGLKVLKKIISDKKILHFCNAHHQSSYTTGHLKPLGLIQCRSTSSTLSLVSNIF